MEGLVKFFCSLSDNEGRDMLRRVNEFQASLPSDIVWAEFPALLAMMPENWDAYNIWWMAAEEICTVIPDMTRWQALWLKACAAVHTTARPVAFEPVNDFWNVLGSSDSSSVLGMAQAWYAEQSRRVKDMRANEEDILVHVTNTRRNIIDHHSQEASFQPETGTKTLEVTGPKGAYYIHCVAYKIVGNVSILMLVDGHNVFHGPDSDTREFFYPISDPVGDQLFVIEQGRNVYTSQSITGWFMQDKAREQPFLLGDTPVTIGVKFYTEIAYIPGDPSLPSMVRSGVGVEKVEGQLLPACVAARVLTLVERPSE